MATIPSFQTNLTIPTKQLWQIYVQCVAIMVGHVEYTLPHAPWSCQLPETWPPKTPRSSQLLGGSAFPGHVNECWMVQLQATCKTVVPAKHQRNAFTDKFQCVELAIQRKDALSICIGLVQPVKETFCCYSERWTASPSGHEAKVTGPYRYSSTIYATNRMTPCLASDSHGFQCFKLQGC